MTISVCVPYWDRQGALDRMFEQYERLYAKTLPIEFSVCDDGTPVPAVVRAPQGLHQELLRRTVLTRLPEKDHPLNPCVPINRAVANSHGEIVVLTNPEIEHPTPILPEMLDLLGSRGDDVYVMARCWDTQTEQWLAGPETNYEGGGREAVPPDGHFHFLVMLWRSLWEAVGGFDEEYRHGQACDDNDWLWRLAEIGARFKTTEGSVWHGRGAKVAWNMPHNSPLFRRKWPEERRAVITTRAVKVSTRQPPLVHPEWALILGGAEEVWEEVLAWEQLYGRPWDGLVIAANDVGSHWPRSLDHWVTLHPDKFKAWKALRAQYAFIDGSETYETWGRRARGFDHNVRPWAGGASGMLAVQVAQILGCTRAVLCGIPMTPTSHFVESTVQVPEKPWSAVAGHWRAWERELPRMQGWVRSMSGRTEERLGAPTLAWLLEQEEESDAG